jgi:hypothetical protein
MRRSIQTVSVSRARGAMNVTESEMIMAMFMVLVGVPMMVTMVVG